MTKNVYKKCNYCEREITVSNLSKHEKAHFKVKIQKRKQRKNPGKADTEGKERIRKNKISTTMKLNPKAGGLREGSGRGIKQWYESKIAGKVYLRSSYEIEYAKWLDTNNIIWKQNLIKFPYEWEGKIRYYYPDFYLENENCYIEIKGYETEKDKAKWRDFPFTLKVLKLKELKELGINIR